ncbi:MAG: restriction endonuclease subunit S [Alphaproteobacteria bacterium]|nr:restriction endonuclease subunit S [Alphaproteobacteria bacterium]
MREMKDSGIEWIGKIPKYWEISKIHSVYSERKQIVSDTEYAPLSVTKNGIVPQLENAAKSDAHDNRKLVKRGDFVINSRSDRRGSSGISELDGSVSLINTVMQPRNNMDNKYYNFVFKTERFCDEFYRFGHGIVADLWSTHWAEMKNICIPMPDLQEQQAIADYLDGECARIDGIVTTQRQIIERLKEYKKSVITEAVTRGLNPNAPMKDSGIEWIGKIPEHWKISKLKYYSKYITDGTHTTPEYLADGVPFLSIKDISAGKLDFSNTKYISQQQHEELSKHAPIEKGDILFTRIGTLGVSVIVETDITFDIFVSVGLLKPKDNINTKHLNYVMNSEYYYQYIQLVKAGEGTSAAKFNLSDVSNSPIVCPPLSEQQAIADYLDRKCGKIDNIIEKRERMIELMTEYKKSLIYECVTGKKEIVDVVE